MHYNLALDNMFVITTVTWAAVTNSEERNFAARCLNRRV